MAVFGVWMWPQSIQARGAQKTVAVLAQAGVTDIFFLTKGLAGTAAYKSAFAPPCCARDLLGELLLAAHASGIRVHAWLTSASDEHFKALYPQSGRCHYTRGRDKGLIALTDAGYLAYMENIVSELCRQYDIDGLHLDYIRYNHLLYGWSEEDQQRYAAAGADITHLRALMDRTFLRDAPQEDIFDALRTGDPSAVALADARRKDVVHFASTLTACARAQNSSLPVSAALMPEGAYEDTAFADLHYGQSYKDAATLYDFVLPMAYSKAYEKDSRWVNAVAKGTLRSGNKTVMGLHAYEGATGLSLKADMAALEGAAIDGVCLFREGAFAWALAQGNELILHNTLDEPITAIRLGESDRMVTPDTEIAPGAQQHFTLAAPPGSIQVFTKTQEACVCLRSAANA